MPYIDPQAILDACGDIILKRLAAFALNGLIAITKIRVLPALRAQLSRLTKPTRKPASTVGPDNRRNLPSPRRGQGRRGRPRR